MDLWDTLSTTPGNTTESPVPEQASRTPTDMINMKPADMILYDQNNQDSIYAVTDKLRDSLAFCENIVVAAYKVADYVPDLSNNEHAKFWKEQVIPNLVKSLSDDVKARSVMMKSLSSIRDLSITIQKAGEIVSATKGSPDAIAIAQQIIPKALSVLQSCIAEASTLENSAITTFADQTGKLFQIIGPEAVRFVDQKAEVTAQLKQQYDEQQKLYSELGRLRGEIQRLSHLIHVTEQRVNGAEKTLDETKNRTKRLMALNDEIEQTIKSIPVSTPQTTSTTTHANRGWWFWRNTSSSTVTNTTMVQNPNREVEKNYYESIVSSRVARIKENQNEEESKEKVKADLDKCLSEYKSAYETALKELEEYNRSLPERNQTIQNEIDESIRKIEAINQSATNISNMVGHHGNTLIQCLVEVRTFAKSLHKGASTYSPLVSILQAVEKMVETDVLLLKSRNRINVFLAGNRLLEQVRFLSSYSAASGRLLQASSEYNSQTNSSEFRALQSRQN